MLRGDRSLLMMLTLAIVFMVLVLFLTAATGRTTESLRLNLDATVVHVTDGDTFSIIPEDVNSEAIIIRLHSADAPERKQVCTLPNSTPYDCYGEAKEALRAKLRGGELVCWKKGRSYERIVMQCTVDDEDIGLYMVRSGLAMYDPRYTKGVYLGQMFLAQTAARVQGLGMWKQVAPVAPFTWRKEQRKN